jgi:hypothetical protein
MEGNVWEWCNDHYQSDYYAHGPKENPKGPKNISPDLTGSVLRVQRGAHLFVVSSIVCVLKQAAEVMVKLIAAPITWVLDVLGIIRCPNSY